MHFGVMLPLHHLLDSGDAIGRLSHSRLKTQGESGLYLAPEVRELLGWGTYQRFIQGTIGEWGLYMAPEVRELLR